jgi:hypothetical protein
MNFLAASDPIVDLLAKGGPAVILAYVVLAFMRGWIVPGKDAEKLREERDKALELVYKQAEIAQRALEVGEKK